MLHWHTYQPWAVLPQGSVARNPAVLIQGQASTGKSCAVMMAAGIRGAERNVTGGTSNAALRTTLQLSPQPSDFSALCAQLQADVRKELPGWKVNETSPVSFTHVSYSGEEWFGPWQVECWAGVVKA
jgi:hypothetical protein